MNISPDQNLGKEIPNHEENIISSVCSSHCGGQCLFKIHIKDGMITRIETDEGQEPQIRACMRGRAYRQRVYSPDRLKFPMRRIGARGEGKFERISWNEALDTVANEIKRIRDTFGPGSIILRGGGGDLGFLHNRTLIDRLLGLAGGYSQTWGKISYEGGVFAELASFGTNYARNSRDNLQYSKLIIMWGWDPANTIQDSFTCWYLTKAKESGVKIISVDPKYTDTAAVFADRWVPIRPCTDTAMLIAMSNVIIREDLHDKRFLDNYTIGFDKFKNHVLGLDDGIPKTPYWAETITGVPSSDIEYLAKEYAIIKPAALVAGISPGRTAFGEQYHRAAIVLAAITGNIGIVGGDPAGRCHTVTEGFPFMKLSSAMKVNNPIEEGTPKRKNSLRIYESVGLRGKGRINTSQIADAILKGKQGGYPFDYKMLYIVNSNYVNQCPDTNKTIQALNKLEFIVDQEQFMTATAKYSDILLPVCSFLERNDITIGEGMPFYGYMNKAIEPLDECKSHFEIANELAIRMGINDFNDRTEEELLREMVKDIGIPDYEDFKQKGVYKIKLKQPYIAFKEQIKDPVNNPFPTPSGKIEIYSQELDDMDNPLIPPIPKYLETWESLNDPLAKKYPLQLVTTHLKRRAHTQFETLPWLRELQEQVILINSYDAEARDIQDGNTVKVFNERGEVIIKAKITERIMPGVVDIGQGAWYEPDGWGVDRGGCANILTRNEISPGGAVPYNTGLVQVERI